MSLDVFWTALVVPPISLLPIAAAGIALSLRWPRAGRALAGVAILGLLVLSMPAIAQILIVSLERNLPLQVSMTDPPRAIVILSAELSRGRGENGRIVYGPGRLTLERLRAGAMLARTTGLPILTSGGTPSNMGPPLATVMAQSLADDFGLSARWTETQSRDTWQNAQNSAAILQHDGIKSVYLVTDAWHMPRALQAFAHTGLHVVASPTRIDPWPVFDTTAFIPEMQALDASYFALHEWIGRAYYALRG